MGGPILPEMMRWLWRDHALSVDPNDMQEAVAEPAREEGGGRGSG